jgi:secreted Zn-dependent insulinase-like peptidase
MSELIADPKNLNIYIRSKSFEKNPELTPLEDQWYFTKYGKEKFNETLLRRMTQPSVTQSTKKLDLPPPNLLLPKNLDVLPKSDDE